MKYPALFQKEQDGGFTVTFRDIPEAITYGESLEEARSMAQDALLVAMDFYFEDQRPVPSPSSRLRKDEEFVDLSTSAALKVQLLNIQMQSHIRPIDLARRMGVKPQEVTRILDLHHTTKIDTLAAAFSAMGYALNIEAYPLDRALAV